MGSTSTKAETVGATLATSEPDAPIETSEIQFGRAKTAIRGLGASAVLAILFSSIAFWLSGFWAERPVLYTLVIATGTFLPLVAAALYFPRWRSRLPALRERPDSELEQIVVRILMLGVISLFLFIAAWVDGFGPKLTGSLLTSAVGQCLSWALLVHLIHDPAQSTPRRIVGIFCDQFVISWWVFSAGEVTAGLYPFMLWATFGHGFRYGVRFLIIAAAVSALCFGFVLLQSDYWSQNLHAGIGLWIGLLILPAYVTPLINRLNRARAQAEEANRAKGRFLATMSHELRTPLTAIIGMGDLLKSTRVDNDQRSMIATVDTSAQSLLALINDILDFSKIEAGKLSLDVASCDLHEVVARVWMILRGQAGHKGLRLRITLDPRAPYLLEADSKRLGQVFINLVGNAIKFTESGEVELVVRLHEVDGDVAWLCFEVRDTGIGIPPEKQASIFEGFTQADDSIGRRYGGTGLGLSISRQMIELMEGRISVESMPGEGSTFRIAVPFTPEPVAADAPLNAEGASLVLISSDRGVTDQLFLTMARWQVEPVIVEHEETLRGIFADGNAMGGTIVVVNDHRGDPLVEAFTALMETRTADAQPAVIEVAAVENCIHRAREWPVDLAMVTPDDGPALRNALHAALAMRVPFAAEAAYAASAESGAHSTRPDAAAKPMPRRVLLAEDNGTNRLVITRVLEMAGHEVVPAADGDEALDLLAKGNLDIALMDLNMPGTSGLDVVRLHRMTEAPDEHLPIVALTADATAQARQDCSDAGMDDYLTKPIEPEKLFAKIERLAPAAAVDAPGEAEPSDEETVTPISQHPQYRTIVEPVIDHGALDALRKLDSDGEFVTEVLTEFLADTDTTLTDMATAAERKDIVTFKDAAHSLRSSANHVGARRMVRMLLDVREFDPDAFEEISADIMPRLHAEFVEVRTQLEAEIGKKRAGRSRQ